MALRPGRFCEETEMSPDDSGAYGYRGRASGPGAGGLMSFKLSLIHI